MLPKFVKKYFEECQIHRALLLNLHLSLPSPLPSIKPSLDHALLSCFHLTFNFSFCSISHFRPYNLSFLAILVVYMVVVACFITSLDKDRGGGTYCLMGSFDPT